MSSRTGPALYLGGVIFVLVVCVGAAHLGNLWLALVGSYLTALGVAALMSRFWPAAGFRPDLRDYREALMIVGVALVLNELLFGPAAIYVSTTLAARWLPEGYIQEVQGLPIWVKFPAALLLYEGLGYLLHRIAHAWNPLWQRVHSVHHEAEHFGIALSFRLSYAEFFMHQMTRMLLMQLTQIESSIIVAVMGLATYAIFVSHANTSLRFGRFSRYFNTPEYHIWHHDPALRANYSIGLLSVFDRLGGTFHHQDSIPDRLGIEGLTRRRSVVETILLRPLCQPTGQKRAKWDSLP